MPSPANDFWLSKVSMHSPCYDPKNERDGNEMGRKSGGEQRSNILKYKGQDVLFFIKAVKHYAVALK